MSEILNRAIEAAKSGDVFVLSIVISLLILYKTSDIIKFFNTRKKKRIDNIKETLKDVLDDSTKVYLYEELTLEHLKLIRGVRAGRVLREKILEEYSNSTGNFL